MKKESKHNIKVSKKIAREEHKRGREEKRPKKTTPKQQKGNKDIHIGNYLKFK